MGYLDTVRGVLGNMGGIESPFISQGYERNERNENSPPAHLDWSVLAAQKWAGADDSPGVTIEAADAGQTRLEAAYRLRDIVAGWPIAQREAWGRLANRLSDDGFAWPQDEAEAFRQTAILYPELPTEAGPKPSDHFRGDTKVIPAWFDDARLTIGLADLRRT
jgi:hypothetical protein